MKKKATILILSLLAGQLFYKIFDFSWWSVVLFLVMYFLFIKLSKKINFIFLIILFFLVLAVNKLFTLNFNPFYYSFDWEKIIWTNPEYIRLIERYWREDLWLPFRLRGLFYSQWLLFFDWLGLVFKLISPIFLVKMIGFSGFTLILFGFIQFFKNKNKFWLPLFWWIIVVASSACGILTDSKSSLILALPTIVYFMYLGLNNKVFDKYQKYWWLLLLVDVLLK